MKKYGTHPHRGAELGLGWRAWPQHQFEILSWNADAQEPGAIRCRSVDPLLEANDVRLEIERLVLVLTSSPTYSTFSASPCESVSRLHDDPG
jgi:hypothetical protein